MVISISACTSTKKPNLRESLHTEIKSDGSKVFEFSVFVINEKRNDQKAGNKKGERQGKGRGEREARGGRQERSDGTSNDKMPSNKALNNYFEERLSNLPIISLFCRKSYFVLDRLNGNDEITLRAECHDTATTDDYVRFKSSALPAEDNSLIKK
ncbi:hypothetical protein GCM10011501_23460 [Thalassotalea profundi]|uniref:Lipoprotein n=2 Tax=Thalassotalea profundi TaxID=2036687 RepID=A0ABQ3IYT0_9GAMM|nr:hypothetical protein GCM10011501_23460 [Thalassotalea profundi]